MATKEQLLEPAASHLLHPSQQQHSLLTIDNLRNEILKLEEKYGEGAAPYLNDISDLLTRYELGRTFEVLKKKEQKKPSINVGEVYDREVLETAECFSRDFIRKYPEYVDKYSESPLALHLSKRNNFWRSLIGTERLYSQNMTAINDNHCKALIMKARSSKILNENKIRKIFQNFEDIKNLSVKLVKAMETTEKKWSGMVQIFLDNLKEIKSHYLTYIRGLEQAIKEFMKIRSRNTELAFTVVRVELQDYVGTREVNLPLLLCLMLPLLRVKEYFLYLKELHLMTAPSDTYSRHMESIKDYFVRINVELSLSKIDKLQKIAEVFSVIRGDISANDNKALFLDILYRTTPKFIREGPVNLVLNDKKKKECYIYLFSSVFITLEITPQGERHFEGYFELKGSNVANLRPTVIQGLYSFYITKEPTKICLGWATQAEAKSFNSDLRNLTEANRDVHPDNKPPTDLDENTFLRCLQNYGTEDRTAFGVTGIAHADSQVLPSPASSGSLPQLKDVALNDALSLGLIPGGGGIGVNGIGFPGKFPLSDRFMLALQIQKGTTGVEEMIEKVPDIKVIKLLKAKESTVLKGPDEDDRKSTKVTTDDGVAARSIPTAADFMTKTSSNQNRYQVASWKNRLVLVVADQGSNSAGMRSAEIASQNAISYLQDSQNTITDARWAVRELLRSLSVAHAKIVETNQALSSTSLLAGILMETEVEKLKSPRQKPMKKKSLLFLVTGVGTCKAYHWSYHLRSVRDFMVKTESRIKEARKADQIAAPTATKRTESKPTKNQQAHPRLTPGGLGPQILRDCPDLSNIDCYTCHCSEEDLIFVVTNGVESNFDPENLGLNPTDVPALLKSSDHFNDLPLSWNDMDPAYAASLKSRFTKDLLSKIISPDPSEVITPKLLVSRIIDYCYKITQPSREFMEANPHKKVPSDKWKYPGGTDQVTCVCFEAKREKS